MDGYGAVHVTLECACVQDGEQREGKRWACVFEQ